MSDIFVRYFRKEDAERVASFLPHLTTNIVRPNQLVQRLQKLSRAQNDDMGGFQYFVAEEDGLVISFGGLHWKTIPSKGLVTEYEELVTDKAHEGKGAMKKIMRALDHLAVELGSAQTKLTTSGAKLMYEKDGFVVKDEVLMIKKYYQI
ncbi:MAG: GNAT family N-acetyltransferase [Candidatus Paceibacterales bacterium]